MDHHRTRQFRQWLGEPAHKLSFIGQHVMLRQSLREILGKETKLEDDVLRSQFSWFVWDHILAPPDGEASAIEQVDEPKATDRPRVAILPAKAQSKGFTYLTQQSRASTFHGSSGGKRDLTANLSIIRSLKTRPLLVGDRVVT